MDKETLSRTKEILDDIHKRKIEMADSIFVIRVGGYIGDNTCFKMEDARTHDKEIRYLEE